MSKRIDNHIREMLQETSKGLYCAAGDFYIDPWRPVPHAIVTHAHSDHARPGSEKYLAAETGRYVLTHRLGESSQIQFQPFGQPITVGDCRVTFFPAGHILGSAQVRIEYRGFSVVVSGDYKREVDPTCQSFEPVRCNVFVTESTFGLPTFKWPQSSDVFGDINRWWQANQRANRPSLLMAYSLGKAQRLLANVDHSIGPIFTHGAVHNLNAAYELSGVNLPETQHVTADRKDKPDWGKSLIVAPPSAVGGTWSRRFGSPSMAMASGWMQIRGTRRRRAVDRGFVLSDHVDWESLLTTIAETEAEEIWVTHGYSDIVVRYLNEQGLPARAIQTEFVGEAIDQTSEEPETDNQELIDA